MVFCKLITKIQKYKNCDNALLQTGCLGVPEFLHQLQLQTQVGNGERKREMGKYKDERKMGENTAVMKRKLGEENGKKKVGGGKLKRWKRQVEFV